ncbi:conserved hypothetical protein [Paecilomyces variotii No. 5]|uniref:Uncharacterized protein n=1 Tax=Byssochlamys spectabilis (strain No. 5 / NBRC 109023) TaxID=1356009 RepID=V5FB08_BYSSN|nr:conserved hypothetical protein [Paecilomyces variotii No. 5]
MASSNNPDLEAVLKTLSAFANPANTSQTSFNNNGTNPTTHHTNGSRDVEEYEPSDALLSHPSQPQQAQRPSPPTIAIAAKDPVQRPGTNTPDAFTIVTWPAALKHVMRTVSQNEALQSKIRRLIRSQHEHEKQWWSGREALLEKQKARGEKKKKLDEVLRSVGAPVSDSKEVSTAEEDRAELSNYDAKVYKASADMSKALDSELRALGIPFFAVNHSLVKAAPGGAEKAISESSATHTKPEGSGDGSLSREELSALQRRMLELLQDLCNQ